MKKHWLPITTALTGFFFALFLSSLYEGSKTGNTAPSPAQVHSGQKGKEEEAISQAPPLNQGSISKTPLPTIPSVAGRSLTLIKGKIVKSESAFANKWIHLTTDTGFPYRVFPPKHEPIVFDKTNAEGQFLFAVTRPGQYTLHIHSRGATPFWYKESIVIENKRNSVRDLGSIDVSLKDSIYGQVTDRSGRALPFVTVTAKRGQKVLRRTLTNSNGEYRLGFVERSAALELSFQAQGPFSKRFQSAVSAVPADTKLVDKVLDDHQDSPIWGYLFVYTEINKPRDLSYGNPVVYIFKKGKLLFERELTLREGHYCDYVALKPGKHILCMKQGNSLRLGKEITITKTDFVSTSLTEYDQLPTKHLEIELDFNKVKPIKARLDKIQVGLVRGSKTPKYIFSAPGHRIDLEVPRDIYLSVKHKSTTVVIENSLIEPEQEGVIKVKAKQY